MSLYQDELVYSALSRFYVYSGFINKQAMTDFCFGKSIGCNMEYFSPLTPAILHILTAGKNNVDHLIYNHTMLLWYIRFLPAIEQQKIIEQFKMYSNIGKLAHYKRTRFLRYCPLCANEDRQKYGETYWHRTAQIPEITICPQHNCCFRETDITMKNNMAITFYPAEILIPTSLTLQPRDNQDLPFKLSKYIQDIFFFPYKPTSISVGDTLNYALFKAGYITPNGTHHHIKQLISDLNSFYSELSINFTKARLTAILSDDNFISYDICLLGYYLNLRPNDLIVGTNTVSIKDISEKFYNNIAELRAQGLSYAKISKIVSLSPSGLQRKKTVPEKKEFKKKKRHYGDTKYYDKEKDIFYYNQLDNICKKILSKKPIERITIKQIADSLDLTMSKLKCFPITFQAAHKRKESTEQYLLRKVLFFFDTYNDSLETITITKIRDTLNISKKNLLRVLAITDDQRVHQVLEPYIQGSNLSVFCPDS